MDRGRDRERDYELRRLRKLIGRADRERERKKEKESRKFEVFRARPGLLRICLCPKVA